MRIVVVDDQPNIVDMLATVLRFHGFVVNTAGTAAATVARAAEHPPDLILLDVMLPDGDGREVCRRPWRCSVAPIGGRRAAAGGWSRCLRPRVPEPEPASATSRS